MAVHKAIRSNSSAQPQPHHAKTVRAGGPKPQRRRPDHQLKSDLFDTLHQFNRGFATALSALARLQHKDRLSGPRIFPAATLRDFCNRTEALRAGANRDILRLIAKREDRDSARFAKGKS
jgi:hypothetical protein